MSQVLKLLLDGKLPNIWGRTGAVLILLCSGDGTFVCKIHCSLWTNLDHHTNPCQPWASVISNLGKKCDAIRKGPKEATKMVVRKLYISRTISKNNGFQTFPQGINSSLRDNLYCFVVYKAINSCWDWLIAKAKLRHVINLKSHLLWVYYKAIEIIAVAQQTKTENTQTHARTHKNGCFLFKARSAMLPFPWAFLFNEGRQLALQQAFYWEK